MENQNFIPIQETQPDGSIIIKKQMTLFKFLEDLEKVPPIIDQNTPNILSLGFYKNIEFKLYLIDGEYWCLRKDLEKIYPRIKDQYNRLCKEFIKEFRCYWLEENIDFKTITRGSFFQKFPKTQNVSLKTGGKDLILLSVEGIIKLVARASKIKTVLFWLIKKFTEYRLLKFEVETLWDKLQKTESPAETYYYLASMRKININRLEPQVWIGKYRGDFVIDDIFLVMIKGWRYHSSKDQQYKDAQRERYIQKQGKYLITFWAYEIFEDVDACVDETIEIILKNKILLKKD